MEYRGNLFRPVCRDALKCLFEKKLDTLFDEECVVFAVPGTEEDDKRCVILDGCHRLSSMLMRCLTHEDKQIIVTEKLHVLGTDYSEELYSAAESVKARDMETVGRRCQYHNLNTKTVALITEVYSRQKHRSEVTFTDSDQAYNLHQMLKSRLNEVQRQELIEHPKKRTQVYEQLCKEGIIRRTADQTKDMGGLYAFLMNPKTQNAFFRHFKCISSRNRLHENILLASLQMVKSVQHRLKPWDPKQYPKASSKWR